jgi:hypothetical protein
VAEETGIQVTASRIAFVLESTSWEDESHELTEIVFVGEERDPAAQPKQLEPELQPFFVSVDRIHHLGLLPPISGYVRGFAQLQGLDSHYGTASYLGNVWRAEDERS